MEQDRLQDLAERDQLWASLRELRDEIDKLATGELTGTQRQQQLCVLLARIVAAELDFQSKMNDASSDAQEHDDQQ